MAGGGVPQPDIEDARTEARVDDKDSFLLELHTPQLLSVHTRVRDDMTGHDYWLKLWLWMISYLVING